MRNTTLMYEYIQFSEYTSGSPSVLNCGVYALWAIPFAYSPPHKSQLSPTEKLKGAFIAPQNTLPLSYSPVSMFTGERQTLANGRISHQRFLGHDTAPQTRLEESLADNSRGQLHPVLRLHLRSQLWCSETTVTILFRIRIRSWRSQLWRSETTVTKALPDQDPILAIAALVQ